MALDGDVDFSPEALLLLIDRMKKNPKVGAACGRIKPGGSGKITSSFVCILTDACQRHTSINMYDDKSRVTK